MQRVRAALAIVSLAALAACSVETPTAPTELRPSFAVQPVTQTICSSASATGWVAEAHPNWAAAIGGSQWIVPLAGYSQAAPALAEFTLDVNLPAIPAGATGISLSGTVMADNGLIITLNAAPAMFTSATPPNYSDNNFQNAAPFGTVSGFNAGGANVLHFKVINENSPPAVANQNPVGLDYCFDLTYTEAPPPVLIPMFVIGDVEPHAIGDNVYFWGAQWSKNNFMSGEVSNGVASFKGYATQADINCGGTWEWVSRPGASSNPPPTIASRIAIIVTTKVIKAGAKFKGDIYQIVLVDQDGNYSPNPGHEGQGKVAGLQCPVP